MYIVFVYTFLFIKMNESINTGYYLNILQYITIYYDIFTENIQIIFSIYC